MRGCGIGYGNQTGNKENFKTYLDEQKESEYVVLVGTVGKSSVLEKLNGRVPLDKIRGKGRAFCFRL